MVVWTVLAVCLTLGSAMPVWSVSFNVGVETSLRKLHRDGLNLGPMADHASIGLARNEYEGFQLVITDADEQITNLRVAASDLVHEGGLDVIAGQRISINPVGYVNTVEPTWYTREWSGRWPDPLLNIDSVNVPVGKVQPIWVSVYAPPGKPAGNYTGTLTITGDNIEPRQVSVQTHVYDFDIPVRGAFDAMVVSNTDGPTQYYQGATGSNYDRLKENYIDFMMAHRLSPGGGILCGWTGTNPTSRVAVKPDGTYGFANASKWGEYARDRGMGKFVVGYMNRPGSGGVPNPPTEEYYDDFTDFMTAYAEFLDGKGWLEDAVVYNIDQVPASMREYAKENYRRVKAVDPRLNVFQCLNDADGVAAMVGYADVWDITLGTVNWGAGPDRVAAGDEVWSCLCCWPASRPNLFVDYPAMDARIVGLLSWKLGLQGFEYWSAHNWWRSLESMGGKLYVDQVMSAWNANSYAEINGDGYLMYPGPNQTLLSSIRFEALRDGFEDYEYLALLRERLDALQASGQWDNFIAQMLPLLEISDNICMTDLTFTDDPYLLLDYRGQIAEAIERANAIPEPATIALILSGAGVLLLGRRRFRQAWRGKSG